MIYDLLYSKNFRNRDLFDADKVISAYKSFLSKGANNTFHIWQWINIEKFFQTFIDNSIHIFLQKKKVEYIHLDNI